jgi:GMP synthase-like glutamine amidotransferase
MSRRIAILLTSNDTSEFARRFPDDGLKVQTLLRDLRPDWAYRIWSVKDGEFPTGIDAADGYIITGSPASVHDPLDWIAKLKRLIQELHAAEVPLVGLCFGHQAVALGLGGRVERNPGGWRLGIATTHFHRTKSYMQPFVPDLDLYAAHNEQVTQLPPGAELLGGDAFCPNASFAIGGHVFTTEYHPEFTPDFLGALADELDGKLPPEVILEARRDLSRPAQGALFAAWIVRFFEEVRC